MSESAVPIAGCFLSRRILSPAPDEPFRPAGFHAFAWFGAVNRTVLLAALATPFLAIAGIVTIVLLLAQPAENGSLEAIGPSSPIPAAYVPLFNEAGQTWDVNPYLLASEADQESAFYSDPTSHTPNSADCVGFVQLCIGGAGGDSWDSSVTLVGPDAGSVVVKDAYRAAARPASYPYETTSHPDITDTWDNLMGAAVFLRGKVGGHAIPNLDETAYEAACGYYGACSEAGVDYAPTVLARARQWASESALIAGGGAAAPIGVVSGETATINGQGQALAPSGAPAAVQEILAGGNLIVGFPYVYGGGYSAASETTHPEPNGGGYDCASSVSYALHAAGLLASAENSEALESYGSSGPGRWVTIYANKGHAFMEVAGIVLNTAWYAPGVIEPQQPPSGPRWQPGSTIPLQIAGDSIGVFTERHPPGL
jgi:hypothetical protein